MTGVVPVTVVVVIANDPLVMPAATVTLVGTLAAVLFELESETIAPFAPAGPLSVTVAIEFMRPPTTCCGLTVTLLAVTGTGVKARTALALPRYVAVIVAVVFAMTVVVVTVKFALSELADTVTLVGTTAALVSLVRFTVVALLLVISRVTVPVLVLPPVMLDGETVKLATRGKRNTVTAVVAVLP